MKLFTRHHIPQASRPYTPPPTRQSLPPDGSYPARLLSKIMGGYGYCATSIWLPNGETVNLIPDQLIVRPEDKGKRLLPLNGIKEDVYVNGQLLMMSGHLLQDGDFIYWGKKNRLIYQADPARDRRSHYTEETENSTSENESVHLTPEASKTLYKYTIIDTEGISFNGGEDFARWDEIVHVALYTDWQSGCDASISIRVDGEEKRLKSKLTHLSSNELTQVILWLNVAVPFDLPLWTNTRLWELFPDAYYAAAWEKIYVPVEQGTRLLPGDDLRFVFGFPSQRTMLKSRIISYGIATALFLFFLITLSARYNVGTALMIIAGLLVFVWVLSKLSTWSENRKWARQVNTAKRRAINNQS